MRVKRIVPDLLTQDPAGLAAFYNALLGTDTVMQAGFIATIQGQAHQPIQLSLAQEGGSGTDLPVMSIEVDDLNEAFARARRLGAEITYGPVTEPWGVRRFYLRDPAGHLVNILCHDGGA